MPPTTAAATATIAVAPLPLLTSPLRYAADAFYADAPVAANVAANGTQERGADVTDHLPLVRFVVGRMARVLSAHPILEFDDLVGYGTEGLLRASRTFDPHRGTRFSTWAVLHIRTAVLDALRTLDPLSQTMRASSNQIEATRQALAQRTGVWPTTADVATVLNQPVERVRRTIQVVGRSAVSLDAMLDPDDETERATDLGGLIDEHPEANPEAVFDGQETRGLLWAAVGALPEREAFVIRQYYQQGQPMGSIAEQFGVTNARASQLHHAALRRLRTALTVAMDEPPARASLTVRAQDTMRLCRAETVQVIARF